MEIYKKVSVLMILMILFNNLGVIAETLGKKYNRNLFYFFNHREKYKDGFISEYMENSKGFTLLELIMVICIISIVSCVVILNGNVLSNHKEKKELKELINDLNYTRNNAIIESKKYILTFIPNKNYYLIHKVENKEIIVKKKEFTNGIKILKTSLKGDKIIFNSTGAPSNAGTINLENSKGEEIEITIGVATGKIRVYFK